MHIIAITGLARSGKDTAAKYISEKYGFVWFDFSRDVLAGELKKHELPLTKENMSAAGDKLRKKYGQDALAQRLVEKIKESGAKSVIISGVRSPEEAIYLKSNSEIFMLINLVADANKRIKRSGNADIERRDEQDIKNKGLAKVLEMADITIENNSTVNELYKKIDDAITRQALF
ncbi:MAG: AAA family ATPase [Nanoarchaeota archaeon]|nr:AAA family ATPase [Nanoarchaeota archaeon]MBU4299850.1 AAA family ATPase [Nanoarchaeota archaeon]MBU4451679.1 AAA family ATPase [Nanoarchaeota archaeon]MCG2723616.1 AAA family ATPase [archaeon]